MCKSHWSKTVTIIAVGIAILGGWSCSQQETTPGAWHEETLTATVPQADCAPILLDGLFSEGEWDGALAFQAGPNGRVLMKQDHDYFYIGVDSRNLTGQATNLFLAADSTEILQFHVSAQVAERKITRESTRFDSPDWDWGYSDNWMANEARWNEREMQRLLQETGQSRGDLFAQVLYPSHGAEFQFRKSRFSAQRYYFRLDLVYPPDYAKNPEIFPEGTAMGEINGWAVLEL